MRNKFLSISSIYWFIILVVLYNLSNSSTFKDEHIWIFSVSSVILYLLIFIINRFITNHDKKVSIINKKSSKRLIYYESKTQYMVVTIILFVLFSLVTIFNFGGFGKISIYFLVISVIAIIFLFLYPTSSFEITDSSFIWKKGRLKISCPWSEVLFVHYDWAPALVNASRGFKTTNFFIETKNGMTAYADKSSIKCKGVYTISSVGDELIAEIKKRSSVIEKTGSVSSISMFKKTRKSNDIIFLSLVFFLITVIIIAFYFLI